ncbi:hypothetical protein BH18ACT1_BH18ACT1_08000 [soil metagenome]|nr:cytochrome C oxidase subunit IV family protein [Acidimicrobiia bacterium]
MSLQEAATAGAAAHEETLTGEGHAHPNDRSYVGIALLLAFITAIEVVSFYVEDSLGALVVPALLIMMVVKFAVVAGWFMHLRFDSGLFTRLFLAGLVLATFVYLGVLTSLEFFGDDGQPSPITRIEEQGR